MSLRLAAATWLALLAAAWPAQAQEKVTIRFAKPKQGDVTLVDKKDQYDYRVTDPTGKGDLRTTTTNAYRETILDQSEGIRLPNQLKRHYTRAAGTFAGKTATQPYQGKTVLIEKKDDKYRFQIQGGKELTGKAAEKLDQEFNPKDEPPDVEKMLGLPRTVAVGETWNLDNAALEKAFPGFALAPATKATATLVKAYQKDGRQFGVLKIKLQMVLKSFSLNGQVTSLQAGSKMTMLLNMAVCIDGSANLGTLEVQINSEMIFLPPGQKQRTVMATKGKSTETRKAPPK